ncbi:gliding motility-associated C-terminal domain-containing protein [Thermaurantimonas aggregans]|uniref:gliding motility-associated C-terminal domain-containing protein n=1 Tax=Thermaurantimonas aggregans TaxID=2173829 RepID=UPI0023EFE034|nr:gliding motility-associated C-terminal domain-containing protein [Thermaurantimonas aggregans]MCX8149819.1 gliding motility-associated C-terminal domain-containing protein [Thermaurantimonas aggregans]
MYNLDNSLVFSNTAEELVLNQNINNKLLLLLSNISSNYSFFYNGLNEIYFIKNTYESSFFPNYINSSLSNNKVHRILNSDADDINQVIFDLDMYQGLPHSTFGTFPSQLPFNSLPPVFSVKNSCIDSTHFHLNYTAIADSVWWDFGDPAGLGPLNHSTQFHPVVKYPQHGTYYVQVQLWYDGDSITTMGDSVKVLPVPQVDLGFTDTLLCRGESVLLDASQGFPASYLWSTGSSDSTLSVNQSGRYWVQVSTPCGTVSDTVIVSVIDPPEMKVHDTAVCFFGPVLYDVLADSATYLWSDGSTSPTFAPRQMGNYWVEVTNPCGGYRQDFRVELQNCETTLYIPNAFTPNGDGRNDCFQVVGDNLSSYQIQVFSRWGELVYESDDVSQCWDGTHRGRPVPDGVYLYVIRHTDRHGAVMPVRRGEIRLYR